LTEGDLHGLLAFSLLDVRLLSIGGMDLLSAGLKGSPTLS